MFAGDPAARARVRTRARGGALSKSPSVRVRQTMGVPEHPPEPELPIGTHRDRLSTAPAASPAEAAAIVAALERFMRDTTPHLTPAPASPDPWARAAILEAVGHEDDAPSAWGDPLPWS
jgi:hypothetical protein